MVWQGNTVLHLGAGWGNVKVVALLLEVRTMSRLSVQQQPRFESFFRHGMAHRSKQARGTTCWCWQAGAGVRCRNLDGKTAGELAAEKGMRRVQAFLDNWEPVRQAGRQTGEGRRGQGGKARSWWC